MRKSYRFRRTARAWLTISAAVALLLALPILAGAQPQPGSANSMANMPGMNMPASGAANSMGNMPGMNMGPTQPTHWQLWAILAVVVLFILFSLAHRAGLLRRVSEGVAGGLALLFIVYFLTSYLVTRYHNPNQTPLLQANTMNMSAMRAPAGSVPVATEILQPGPFSSGVTYTGTVVALNDEDVYPRVPGTIVDMPVYPGDHVVPGELLVRLDDQEYSALQRAADWLRLGNQRGEVTAQRQEEMAAAGRTSAQADATRLLAEVRVAQRQLTGAEAAVTESHSAVQQSTHDLAAAQSEETSAQQARDAAQADAQAAAAGVDSAQADIDSATADLQYWQEEIKREKTLLDKGAVSTEEYQREQSEYAAARSKLAQAQSSLREKRAMVSAAQAQTRQAEAAIGKAQAQAAAQQSAVEQAQAREARAGADRDTAQAQVQAAQAAYQAGLAVVSEKAAGERASASQVTQAAAAVSQSAAALTAATTVRGYTEIRATQPGKVIERPVSPGVLAEPGMMLLRIAQVNQVRLQAYVTEQDLRWLRVGDPVEARQPRLPGGVLHARVTSIFPAANPATRTAIVEALVDNPGEILAPGDAISMTITTPPRQGVLTVPNSAIVYLPVPGAAASAPQQAAVWVAGSAAGTSPGATGSQPGGVKTAHQIKVTLGASDGERTEIVAGLSAGQEVIYRGQINLHEGDQVYPVPWSAQGPMELPPAPGATAAPSTGGTAPAAPAAPAMPNMPGMKMGSSALLPPFLSGEGAGGEVPRVAGLLVRRLATRLLQRGWW